jgi:hypothetical protein
VWLERVKKATIDYRVLPGCSRHLVTKQMRYKIGVGLMVKLTNDPFPTGSGALAI